MKIFDGGYSLKLLYRFYLLQDLKSKGKYIFIVHHDLSKVETYFDQLILMKQQLISVGPTKQVFTPKKLAQAFGQSLVVLGGE